jgi:four helix bundle protein
VVQAAARARDHAVSQQLNRAAVSIMANIAEGCLRRSPREFAPFISIAAGSNAEARALLYVAADRNHVGTETIRPLVERSNEVGRMLHRLLKVTERDARATHLARNRPGKAQDQDQD